MTVIAWDGKTLAADKQATNADYKHRVTKIIKYKGVLLFSSGDFGSIQAIYDWYKKGAKPSAMPKCQDDKDDWAALHIIKKDRSLWRYERSGYPWKIEEKFYACGSGRDFALAAMHCGKNAREAVEIACKYCSSCGLGVDYLVLK